MIGQVLLTTQFTHGSKGSYHINTIRKVIRYCRVDLNCALNGTQLLLEFTLTQQSNKLLHDFPYSKRQTVLFDLIHFMHVEEKMSYRKITKFLNRSGIKTATGKTWHTTGSSVYSVLKRMKKQCISIACGFTSSDLRMSVRRARSCSVRTTTSQ